MLCTAETLIPPEPLLSFHKNIKNHKKTRMSQTPICDAQIQNFLLHCDTLDSGRLFNVKAGGFQKWHEDKWTQ